PRCVPRVADRVRRQHHHQRAVAVLLPGSRAHPAHRLDGARLGRSARRARSHLGGRRPRMSSIISVRDLKVSFASEAGRVDAVRGVSFDLEEGKTLGIVGESGSGKSVTSLAIMGLLDENAKVSGSIVYDGEELLGKTDKQMSVIRGNGLAMIFQDPLTSLTPVFTIGDQLIEALTVHRGLSKKQAWDRAIELLTLVGIPQPEKRMKGFPHEFSGGMRQRVVIAIAMANN